MPQNKHLVKGMKYNSDCETRNFISVKKNHTSSYINEDKTLIHMYVIIHLSKQTFVYKSVWGVFVLFLFKKK